MFLEDLPRSPAPAASHSLTCRDARTIIRNPVRYNDRPILRRLSWSVLKSERGQTVNHAQLSKMHIEMAR